MLDHEPLHDSEVRSRPHNRSRASIKGGQLPEALGTRLLCPHCRRSLIRQVTPGQRWLDCHQAALRLGRSCRTVRYWARTRRIAATQLGKAWSFDDNDIEAFIRQGRNTHYEEE